MKKDDWINKLLELVSYIEINIDNHEYLPLIVEKISLLISGIRSNVYNPKQIMLFTLAMERYMSEDMVFCKTALGTKIFSVLNSIIEDIYLELDYN